MNKKGRGQYEKFHASASIQTSIISKNNFTYRILLAIVSAYLNSPKKILDIGCGVGTVSLYLASKGNNVLGIDIAKSAIETCKKSANVLGLDKSASFAIMRFPKEAPQRTFDLILCSEVLEHLKEDEMALAKIYALLRPGGVAIISTPSKNAPLYTMGYAHNFDKRAGHVRRYTLRDLVTKCKLAGFEIVETKKTEGVLRNFLFLNSIAGKFVRFIKFFLSDIVSWVDNISLLLFGESQIFVVARKPS